MKGEAFRLKKILKILILKDFAVTHRPPQPTDAGRGGSVGDRPYRYRVIT